MKHMKKLAALLLAAVLLTAALSVSALAADKAGLDNFKKTNEWKDGTFSDVTSGDWFYENVKAAYELGLMIGQGDKFGASSSITVAETVTLAARLYAVYTADDVKFEQGSPWYQVYADYVEAKKIADLKGFNMQAAATRAQFAYILASAIPAEGLAAINDIENDSVPDVPSSDTYADAIYSLYRSGVLTGSDSRGTFLPRNTIKRSEVAAIVTRMADESLRKKVDLHTDLVVDAVSKTIPVTVKEKNEATGKEESVHVEYTYVIPKVSLKGAKADALNKRIYDAYAPIITKSEREIVAHSKPATSMGIDYDWYVNGDVLSIVIGDMGSPEVPYDLHFSVLNVTLSGCETLTVGQVAQQAGYSIVEYATGVADVLRKTFDAFYSDYADSEAMKGVYQECLDKTIDYANVQKCVPFIDENGTLCVSAYIYPIAGPETINVLLTLQKEQ